MQVSICDTIANSGSDSISVSACESYAEGILNEGLEASLTRQFENIRYLLSLYQ